MSCYCQSGWTCPECSDALREKIKLMQTLIDAVEAELRTGGYRKGVVLDPYYEKTLRELYNTVKIILEV